MAKCPQNPKIGHFAILPFLSKNPKFGQKCQKSPFLPFFGHFLQKMSLFAQKINEFEVLKPKICLQNGCFATFGQTWIWEFTFFQDLTSKIFILLIFPYSRNTPWPVGFHGCPNLVLPVLGFWTGQPQKLKTRTMKVGTTQKSWKGQSCGWAFLRYAQI